MLTLGRDLSTNHLVHHQAQLLRTQKMYLMDAVSDDPMTEGSLRLRDNV